ncbi:hypothetical protein ECG_07968 [Echinococcus granulosus]|uniref:C type lectin fold n=1 Tax=Echinococcus granulosus TaxID=6210 RepID=A0A068X1V6_ECHGR|nr:hypothetical protein ECG_07968 [Echinococcus granulosus]CDS24764.1 C type lectin fold [Echinococcus granulosus]
MIWTVALGLLALLHVNFGEAARNYYEDEGNTVLPRTAVPIYGLKRPFQRESNSVVKPLANFATGVVEKDKLWMLLPWKLGKKVNFPVPKKEFIGQGLPKRTPFGGKKVFLAPYPYKLQGGELRGYAMAEMACREAGEAFFSDGGFRALLTTKNRPLGKILPRHLSVLPVLNLHGELVARSWRDFLDGRLANATLISMDGIKDSTGPRWEWKYYWLGDGYKRTCDQWTSSYLMDVANVVTFDYANNEVVHDVASCSSDLHLLCYSVCEDFDLFL